MRRGDFTGQGLRLAALVFLLICLLAGTWASAARADGVAADGLQAGAVFDARVSYVVDGDSIWVKADSGGRARLRLADIDAPEICQPGGPEARQAMRALVLDQAVRVTVLAHDRYDRAIARVQRLADGADIGQRMVAQGWAWNESFRGRVGSYAAEQRAAEAERRGIFAGADAPELPASFRQRHGPCELRADR